MIFTAEIPLERMSSDDDYNVHDTLRTRANNTNSAAVKLRNNFPEPLQPSLSSQ